MLRAARLARATVWDALERGATGLAISAAILAVGLGELDVSPEARTARENCPPCSTPSAFPAWCTHYSSNWGGMTDFDGDAEFDPILSLAGMGILGDLWKAYNDVLEDKPILTKACTSLCGFSIGDVLAQKFVSPGDDFDYKRLARMASFGFVIHGTVSHFFYNKLEEVIPGKDAIGIISKVLTDQLLWAPIFTIIVRCHFLLLWCMVPRPSCFLAR